MNCSGSNKMLQIGGDFFVRQPRVTREIAKPRPTHRKHWNVLFYWQSGNGAMGINIVTDPSMDFWMDGHRNWISVDLISYRFGLESHWKHRERDSIEESFNIISSIGSL